VRLPRTEAEDCEKCGGMGGVGDVDVNLLFDEHLCSPRDIAGERARKRGPLLRCQSVALRILCRRYMLTAGFR
jgi:hypothetical protein